MFGREVVFVIIYLSTTANLCFDKKKKEKSVEDEDADWIELYGKEGQKIIRDCVEKNIPDYEYLKQFAIKA